MKNGLIALGAAFLLGACVAPNDGVEMVSRAPITEESPAPSPKPSATPVANACVPSTIAGKGITTLRPLGTTTAPYGFIEYLPPGYADAANAKRLWPLIVMLHGSGECGNGTTALSKVAVHGPNKRIAAGREFPAVIVTPQSPGSWNVALLDQLVDYLFAHYRLDQKRFYLTGLSLGGGGTWNYARLHADRLAAAMPICGYSTANDSSAERAALTSIPIYTAQNLNDMNVTPVHTTGFADSIGASIGAKNEALDGYLDNGKNDDTTAILNYATKTWEFDLKARMLRDAKGALRSGVRTIFTFPQVGGHDAWTTTYAAEDTWNWLFCQHR